MIAKILRPSVLMVMLVASASVSAQGFGGGPPPRPPPSGKVGAPADFTGYWVSLITEDWQYRLMPPTRISAGPRQPESIVGVTGVPMNAEARKIALAWNPAKDVADGEQCKAYGAGNIMRIPERIHITWEDDQTMRLDTDAGMQSRFFEFKTPKRKGGDWQGISRASWETVPGAFVPIPTGSLKVVSSHFRAGYLDKNGVPYSANAVVTEYFDRVDESTGSYLVVSRTVEDPTFLTQPYLTAVQFQKEPDGSRWNPSPCSVR
ncbi:MAG: hypothetical protein ACRD22_04495 [Terriglobia bacterium]